MPELQPQQPHRESPTPSLLGLPFPPYRESHDNSKPQEPRSKLWTKGKQMLSALKQRFVGGTVDNVESMVTERQTGKLLTTLVQNITESRGKSTAFRPLNATLTTQDETGQMYTTIRQLRGQQIEQYVFQDKTQPNDQPDCVRILMPKNDLKPGEFYLLQTPRPMVRDVDAAEILLTEIENILLPEEQEPNRQNISIIRDMIRVTRENKHKNDQEQGIYNIGRVNGAINYYLKSIDIANHPNIEKVVEMLLDDNLWIPSPGELTGTAMNQDGQVFNIPAYDLPDRYSSASLLHNDENDQSVVKPDVIALNGPLESKSDFRTGTLSQFLLPFIIRNSRLNVLIQANPDTSGGKRVENTQKSLSLARSNT